MKPSTQVTMEYCKRLPQMPTRTLTSLIMKEHPKLFASYEVARSAVRTVRGKIGNKTRSQCKSFKDIPVGLFTCNSGNMELPEPIKEIDPWQIVQVEFDRGLVLNDVHIPYHDANALKVAVAYGKKQKVDCVIINGDFCDFYSISAWEKNPEKRNYIHELKLCRQGLGWLRGQFPKARMIFKEGNHEERLWRYMWRTCPDFSGLEDFSLPNMLKLADFGIEVVMNKKPIRCGEHLHVLHGHEFGVMLDRSVNPARGLYNKAHCNAVCGDVHQSSNHTEPGLSNLVSTWSIGCLCELHPFWYPINKWNHGFAIIELDLKQWRVDNKKIIKGEVV